MKTKVKTKDPLVSVKLTDAKVLKDYVISFKFSDGNEKSIDFKNVLDKNVGGCNKFLDKKLFSNFHILDNKDIAWGEDWDMIFPFYSLYAGLI